MGQDIEQMDRKADETIVGWSLGVLAANILPSSASLSAMGVLIAKLGSDLARIYDVEVDAASLKYTAKEMARDIIVASTARRGIVDKLKYVPGLNVWMALLVQPSEVTNAVSLVGSVFKETFHELSNDEKHSYGPEAVDELVKARLQKKLKAQ